MLALMLFVGCCLMMSSFFIGINRPSHEYDNIPSTETTKKVKQIRGVCFAFFVYAVIGICFFINNGIRNYNHRTRVQVFTDRFGFEIPALSSRSQSDIGFHGEGIRFYVYELDRNNLRAVLSHPMFVQWNNLPLSQSFIDRIENSLLGYRHSPITIEFLDALHSIENGKFFYREQTPIFGNSPTAGSFYIGLIDIDNFIVYYFRFN
jgi:hypothetical protein